MGKFNIDPAFLEKLRAEQAGGNTAPGDRMGTVRPTYAKTPPPEPQGATPEALRKFLQNPETGAIERNYPQGGPPQYQGATPIAPRNASHFADNPFSQKSASMANVLRGLDNRKTSLGSEVYGPNIHSAYPNPNTKAGGG